mgnify:CR=1 FL=1
MGICTNNDVLSISFIPKYELTLLFVLYNFNIKSDITWNNSSNMYLFFEVFIRSILKTTKNLHLHRIIYSYDGFDREEAAAFEYDTNGKSDSELE